MELFQVFALQDEGWVSYGVTDSILLAEDMTDRIEEHFGYGQVTKIVSCKLNHLVAQHVLPLDTD